VASGRDAYEFGTFRLEPENGCLLRAGVRVQVEPKALRLLELLIQSGGVLVDRDALVVNLWGTVVVTAGSLNRLIAQLRRALDDDAATPRYIATVHTRGYRWLAGRLQAPAATPISELPQRLLPIIGRDADLRDLEIALSSGARLLTLVGPGGTGKTQLALELGLRREQRQPGTVFWVDLSTATDAPTCGRQIAAATEAHERADMTLERSIALVLGERDLLLILDNCERVVSVVAPIARALLGRCQRLHIVCTSQVTLDVAEESLYWVKPLGLPPVTLQYGSEPLAQLRAADATHLFMERACAVVSDLDVKADDAPVIAEICRRLDGLPLALELAAPRLAALTPKQLLSALDHRFLLLTRQGAVDPRHQSLQATLEWSFALLEPLEREFLELCGVFAGPWSIEAAEAVSNIDRPLLLNLIQRLVQRSLLAVERVGDVSRYRLLDSVRAFACARLQAGGHERDARAHHARYFTALATSANKQLMCSNQQLQCLEQLRREWTNLGAAFEWACSEAEYGVLAVEIVSGLRWEFWMGGRYTEGNRWFGVALRHLEHMPVPMRAPFLNGYSLVLHGVADFEGMARRAAEAQMHAEASGQRWEQAWSLGLQSWSAAMLGLHSQAKWAAEKSAAIGAELADPWLLAFADIGLAMGSVLAGDHADAIRRLSPHARLPADFPERQLRGYISLQLGLALFAAGDLAGAQGELVSAVRVAAVMGNARTSAGCCELAAYLTAADEDYELAAWLLGAAHTGRDITGAPLLAQWVASQDAVTDTLRRELGADVLEQAVARGRRTTLPESFRTVVRRYSSDELASTFQQRAAIR
jgi:non-specific serine/threonine protein kinase